jgi:DNA-binding XRE family transcriptional regulator
MNMSTDIDDKIKRLPAARRAKIEARAKELVTEELTLRELRRQLQLTQASVAQSLGLGQDNVSRIERRGDLLLSTLRKTVEAMGGTLRLVAEFPGRNPVVLTGVADDGDGPTAQ